MIFAMVPELFDNTVYAEWKEASISEQQRVAARHADKMFLLLWRED